MFNLKKNIGFINKTVVFTLVYQPSSLAFMSIIDQLLARNPNTYINVLFNK